MVIESPTDSDNLLFVRAPSALTVSAVNCIANAATSVVLTVQECDANGGSCTTVATGTCTTSNSGLTVSDSSVDSSDWLRVDVGTVTGTPGHVAACIDF